MAEQRLQKVLAAAGIDSRRKCEELILSGVVRVNLKVIDTLPAFVDPGKDIITVRLFDPYIGKMIMGKKYKGKKKQWREMAHRFSDEIMRALTGIEGVFNTKIAYSVVTKKGKEIAVMDMDGFDTKQLTKNKSINISPAWSPDGKKLVFTSYLHGNPDLYSIKVGGKIVSAATTYLAALSPGPPVLKKSVPIRRCASFAGRRATATEIVGPAGFDQSNAFFRK